MYDKFVRPDGNLRKQTSKQTNKQKTSSLWELSLPPHSSSIAWITVTVRVSRD